MYVCMYTCMYGSFEDSRMLSSNFVCNWEIVYIEIYVITVCKYLLYICVILVVI